MPTTTTKHATPPAPAAVLDAIRSLHEAEQTSVFRLMGENSAYFDRAPGPVREPLKRLYGANARHVEELAAVIRRLGGVPHAVPPPDDTYLRYLSLEFLLPKLQDEKALMIERYRNALRAMPKTAPADVVELVQRQVAEQAANADAFAAGAAVAAAGDAGDAAG